jgi:transmembrane sensor
MEQLALEAWLAADLRHLGAFAKAEAVLARLERVGAAGADALWAEALDPEIAALKRRTILVGGIAAGLAVAAGGAAWFAGLLKNESYFTSVGEVKEVVLKDGSMITLNTNSKILVDYNNSRRFVRLTQGEALFDVTKNKTRPFIVMAGDTQVRAVGTSFTVRLLPEQPVRVLVREGVVEIKRPDVPQAPPVRLAANTVALAPLQEPISTEPIPRTQVSKDLVWREGRIAFDNETLASAAREFARYSDIQIRVAPELEGQTVTGLFVTNDPVGFARAVAISLDLHVEVADREVRLTHQENATDR